MAGDLTGAALAGEVGDQYKEKRPQNISHSFIVIKLDAFISSADFRARIDTLSPRVYGIVLAPGFKEVLFLGEPEYRLSEAHKLEEIPYIDAEKEMFQTILKSMGILALQLSRNPLNA